MKRSRARRAAAIGGVLVAVAWACAAPSARAEEAQGTSASRVVIVRDRSADPVLGRAGVRLAAELRAAGFAVEEREAARDEDARRLVEDATAGGPFATVLLRRARAGAATDVWVADHVTHKTVVRRLGARGRGDAADRALAMRIVELMRASLVEGLVLPPSDDDESDGDAPPLAPASSAESSSGSPPPPAPAAVRAPPPDVAAWTREGLNEQELGAPARVVLSLGAAAAYAGPDVGVAFAPALRVAWRANDAWSVGLFAAGPAFGARVEAREGSATVRQELALVEVALEPPTRGPVRGFLSLGVGGYHLAATGDATPPFSSGHDDAWAALGSLGAGMRVRLAGAASLVVDAREMLALPRPVLVFGAERVAAAMHPGTMAGVSLAVDL
jgi:hypothetical protein